MTRLNTQRYTKISEELQRLIICINKTKKNATYLRWNNHVDKLNEKLIHYKYIFNEAKKIIKIKSTIEDSLQCFLNKWFATVFIEAQPCGICLRPATSRPGVQIRLNAQINSAFAFWKLLTVNHLYLFRVDVTLTFINYCQSQNATIINNLLHLQTL